MKAPSRVERLGTEKIGELLLEMSSQTTLSLLVYAFYSVTDTYFLSVGINALAAAGASVTNKQLDEAKSLKGATMSDGSKHP